MKFMQINKTYHFLNSSPNLLVRSVYDIGDTVATYLDMSLHCRDCHLATFSACHEANQHQATFQSFRLGSAQITTSDMICLCVAGLAFHLQDGYLIYFSLHSPPVFLIVLGVLNFSMMILPVKKEISVLSSGTVHTTERLLVHFTHMDLPPQFARNFCNILEINRNESVF